MYEKTCCRLSAVDGNTMGAYNIYMETMLKDKIRYNGILWNHLNFVEINFCGLVSMYMFVDTWICGFQITRNITKVNFYFAAFLNSWIAL